jgi:hypothetical protein
VLVLLASSAQADERYDHKGAVGLLIGTTLEYKSAFALNGAPEDGARAGVELGGTYAIGNDGNELKGALRAAFLGNRYQCSLNYTCAPVDLGLYLGYRGYFDLGQWKTFYDLDLVQHLVPRIAAASVNTQLYTIGPRVGLGVQLDFLPIAGAFLLIEGQLGFGDGLRYGVGAMLGVQLRSYLLE